MDKSTHEVRLAGWKAVVEQCQARPRGQTVAQWCEQNDVGLKQYYYWQRRVRKHALAERGSPSVPAVQSSMNPVSFVEIPVHAVPVPNREGNLPIFCPDAVIRSGCIEIALGNSISDSLLDKIMKEVIHAG